MASPHHIVLLLSALLLLLFLFLVTNASATNANTSRRCIESERSALLVFKQSLIDESNRLSSWRGDDCCVWEGVFCSTKRLGGGNVIKLDLRNPVQIVVGAHYNTSLGGDINPSLLILKRLRYLDLSSNNFSSAKIPGFLGSFTYMTYLNLSNSNFMGHIPHSLGNLSTSLEYLHLGNNIELTSSDSISWVSRLTSIKHLDLSTVVFENETDLWHSINMLPSLQVLNLASVFCTYLQTPSQQVITITSLVSLDLSMNCINSTFPLWISNNTGLKHLNLGSNYFYGPIPHIFGRFASLTFLDLSNNPNFDPCSEMSSLFGNLSNLSYLNLNSGPFFGSIPSEMGNLTQLQHLDLQFNKLEGEIPNTFRNLCFLRTLNLRGNNFNGSFFNLLGGLNASLQNSLQRLDLSINKFSGTIPTSIGRLSSLIILDISRNHLSGSIPTSLGKLTELEELYLYNNSLSGMVSEHHFAGLSKLVEVDLSLNSLSVLNNVSTHWIPPFQLEVLNMKSCILGPQFPRWLHTQTHIVFFSVSNASISDTMPDWFESVVSRTTDLDLSHNKISGKLPNIPSHINLLDLSNNLFSGDIKSVLCKLKFVESVDLSQNQLSGMLPSCLGNLVKVVVLDLSNNNLYGRIPRTLGSLCNLWSLHLHNNSFYGELPQSLQKLRALNTVDLGYNNITGVVPSWIGTRLTKLRLLDLQSNKFHGDLPLQLCYLVHLQVLNLANNSLTGSIPSCLSNLTAMATNHLLPGGGYSSYEENIHVTFKGTERKYTKTIKYLTSIDLSNNHITGEIPEGLTSLIGLKGLRLGGNHLEGWIPKHIGNLKQLESLDLSRNTLSGPVPQSLSNLNYLSYMNLSFNNLSGRVPTGNQLQTLGDISSIYMGNSELCGTPIMKSCPGDEVSFNHGPEEVDESGNEEDNEQLWFYAGIGPGFAIGLLGFFSILYFKESWRHAYFHSLENVYNWLLVTVAVKVAQARRKLNRDKLGTGA